jgi:hypothetical protein
MERGETLEDITDALATQTKSVEVAINLDDGMTQDEAVDAIHMLAERVAKGPWPPAAS